MRGPLKRQSLRDLVGGAQGVRPDGEPPGIHLRRCQPGVGWRRVGRRQPGKGRVAVDGPQQAVDFGIGRFDEKAARRGHDRSAEASGGLPQAQGGPVGPPRGGSDDRDPGRMPERQQFGVAGQHHQPLGKIGHGCREIEGRLLREPAAGDQAAQVAVAGRIFHQAHRPAIGVRIGQFRSDDGRDALLPAGA